MSNKIEGKVFVITGASNSLGQATARCSPRRKQALYWARGASSGIKSLADELTGRGGKLTHIKCVTW
jgi:NADP-dependent 3-hydroxy acid dehydrogenase YdfG